MPKKSRPSLKTIPVKYKCEFCPYKTPWGFAMKEHNQRHPVVEKSADTSHCWSELPLSEFETVFVKTEDSHGSSKSTTPRHFCKNCNLSTYSQLILIRHQASCLKSIKPQWRSCKLCPFVTRSSRGLSLHITLLHMKTEQIVTEPEIVRYRCDQCEYIAGTASHLKAHIIHRHTAFSQIQWHKCEYCSFRAKQHFNLSQHVISKHTSEAQINWHKCDKCPFKTKHKSGLKRHLVTQHYPINEAKLFRCEHCLYRTKTKQHLKLHVINVHLSNEDITWFQCDYCSYRAKQHVNLKKHLESHKDPDQLKWFECDQCSYRACRTNLLKAHRRSKHNINARQFKCDQCEYVAKRKTNLRQHIINRHTDLRDIIWVRCNWCSYKSKQRTTMQEHCKRKHGMSLKKVHCKMCTFKGGDLSKHILKVHFG